MTRRTIVSRAAALFALPFARTAEAPAGDLPALPTPDMPAEDILARLIPWTGGIDCAIVDLVGGATDQVGGSAGRDNVRRLRPLLDALADRGCDFEDEAHGRAIRRAIVRHGYDQLPIPPRDPEREPAPRPVDANAQWADATIDALTAELAVACGSPRVARFAMVRALTNEIDMAYQGNEAVSVEDYDRHCDRLKAIEKEAWRRRQA